MLQRRIGSIGILQHDDQAAVSILIPAIETLQGGNGAKGGGKL